MRFLILFSFITLSLSAELATYNDYLIFAAKNHFKTVSEYAKAIGVTQLDSQWEQFKVNFNREYSPEKEEEKKFNFLKTIQLIESHNKLYENGAVTHLVDINEFADWSKDEYESLLTANRMPMNLTQLSAITVSEAEPTFYASLPPTFDWRLQNKVTPVKNQGQCGSCWAFASVATIESAYAIKHSQFVSLSEQQLVDCNTVNNGCNWGNVGQALLYVEQNGIESETEYPYHTRKQACLNSAGRSHLKISGYRMLAHPASDEQIMEAIMNNGPVAVNIDSSGNDFAQYRAGIISTGNTQMNHYVTAVGWGPGFWIIKNSWGTTWGEAGYGRIARGHNVRGFNQWLFYPIL